MSPPKFVRDTAGIALSQYLSRLVQLLRGVVAARIVGPGQYGSWNALLLILEYGTMSQLGIQQGLDQEIPGSLAAGDRERTERLKRGGLAGMIVLWGMFAVAVGVYLVLRPRAIEAGWGMRGPLLMLVSVLLQMVLMYHLTLLRSHGRIGEVSKSLSILAIVSGLAGLALTWWWGTVWGLLYGWLLGQALALVYARVRGRDVAPLRFALLGEARSLLASGFPIFVFLALGFLLRSLDRILIIKYLTLEELGLYSIGLMAVSLLLYIPESVSYVLYPRLIARFRTTGDATEAARDLGRPMATIAWTVPLVVGIAYAWVDVVVLTVLPGFAPGLPAVHILLFGAMGLALASVPSYYIMAIGKQTRLLPLAALAIALEAALILLFLRLGFGITGAALGAAIGYAVFGAGLVAYTVAHSVAGFRGRAVAVARAVLPGAWALILVVALRSILQRLAWPLAHPWGEAALLSLTFAAVYGVTARWVGPRTGLLAVARDSNLPFARRLAGAWARD